jgi:hypothetical protein
MRGGESTARTVLIVSLLVVMAAGCADTRTWWIGRGNVQQDSYSCRREAQQPYARSGASAV